MTDAIKSVSLTTAGRSASAVAFADQLAHSKEYANFDFSMQEATDAKEVTTVASLVAYDTLMKVFGDKLATDTPFPDTDADDVKGTNATPDKYKREGGITNAGKTKYENGSWWFDFVESLPRGAELRDILTAISDKKKKQPVQNAEIAAMDDIQLEQAQGRYNQRLKMYRDTVKIAAKVAHVMHGIEHDKNDKVFCRISKDKDSDGVMQVRNTPFPIVLFSKEDTTKFARYSVPSFVKLDPVKAAANGGTLEAYAKTLDRGTTTTTDNTPKTIKNTEEMQDYVNRLAHYFDGETEQGKKNVSRVLEICSNEKTGDEMVRTLGALCLATDEIWTAIGARFLQLSKEDAKAEKAA